MYFGGITSFNDQNSILLVEKLRHKELGNLPKILHLVNAARPGSCVTLHALVCEQQGKALGRPTATPLQPH